MIAISEIDKDKLYADTNVIFFTLTLLLAQISNHAVDEITAGETLDMINHISEIGKRTKNIQEILDEHTE